MKIRVNGDLEFGVDESMRCPHCMHEYGYAAKEFVIPRRQGAASEARNECEHCDQWFAAWLEGECILARRVPGGGRD